MGSIKQPKVIVADYAGLGGIRHDALVVIFEANDKEVVKLG